MQVVAAWLAFVLAAVLQEPVGAGKSGYVVVVNAANPCAQTGKDAAATARKLFLKEMTQWPGGVEARPYGRAATCPEHAAFVREVLGMTDAELARHWLRMKNMDGTTPPKDVDTDRMVLKYVAKHDGAFGIVRADAVKGVAGVKVLFEF